MRRAPPNTWVGVLYVGGSVLGGWVYVHVYWRVGALDHACIGVVLQT